MPLFALIGRDGPRGAELRKVHREGHLANVERLAEAGRIRYAGPLVDEAGQMTGSVIVFEAGSLEAARETFARDPYVTEGIFADYEVIETRQVFPRAGG